MRMLLVPIGIIFILGAEPAPDAVKKEMALLEGNWTMVSGEKDGQAIPEDFLKSAKRVSKDGETTVTFGETIYLKSKYAVDPAKKPKTIDYTITEGDNKGKKVLGIYEIDGDTVKFCFGLPEKERPTDFTTKEGSDRTLSVWKREKSK